MAPGSDSYRVLGATPDASAQDLRHNMALLMSWLHPDKDPAGDRAVLAARVTRAWTDLRTPDRRTAYDATLGAARSANGPTPPNSRGPSNARPQALWRCAPLPRTARPGTHEAGLHRAEHDTLLRRGWHFLRRALSPRASS